VTRPFVHPHADDLTLDGVLHALADPVRRSILARLIAEGGMSCCRACHGLPPSTTSHHHRVLREAGLIRSERRGTEVINHARRDDADRRFPGLLAAILAADAGLTDRG